MLSFKLALQSTSHALHTPLCWQHWPPCALNVGENGLGRLQLVLVTWAGVPKPTTLDMVALYIPAHPVDLWHTLPVQYVNASQLNPTYLSTGAGQAVFKLLNVGGEAILSSSFSLPFLCLSFIISFVPTSAVQLQCYITPGSPTAAGQAQLCIGHAVGLASHRPANP